MDSLSKLSRLRLGMLEFLPEQRKTNWCHHVNKALHAYNCIKNSATGYASNFLLLGRSPSLHIDVPVDTGRKLNVYKTFNLRPVSTGVILTYPNNSIPTILWSSK